MYELTNESSKTKQLLYRRTLTTDMLRERERRVKFWSATAACVRACGYGRSCCCGQHDAPTVLPSCVQHDALDSSDLAARVTASPPGAALAACAAAATNARISSVSSSNLRTAPPPINQAKKQRRDSIRSIDLFTLWMKQGRRVRPREGGVYIYHSLLLLGVLSWKRDGIFLGNSLHFSSAKLFFTEFSWGVLPFWTPASVTSPPTLRPADSRNMHLLVGAGYCVLVRHFHGIISERKPRNGPIRCIWSKADTARQKGRDGAYVPILCRWICRGCDCWAGFSVSLAEQITDARATGTRRLKEFPD